jgi:hypothetical protein
MRFFDYGEGAKLPGCGRVTGYPAITCQGGGTSELSTVRASLRTSKAEAYTTLPLPMRRFRLDGF